MLALLFPAITFSSIATIAGAACEQAPPAGIQSDFLEIELTQLRELRNRRRHGMTSSPGLG
jgi:hypothetical protein